MHGTAIKTMLVAAMIALTGCKKESFFYVPSGSDEISTVSYDVLASYKGRDAKIDSAIADAMNDDMVTYDEREEIYKHIDRYRIRRARENLKAAE